MTNATNLQQLANQINNEFIYFFEMSSDQRKWNEGNKQEEEITNKLEELNQDQLIELKGMINASMENVNRYFAKYFENLPEPQREQSMRSKIFTNAWRLIKMDVSQNMSEALTLAWKRFKLMEQLKNGVVYLTYKKADSTIRKAIATLRQGNFFYTFKTDLKREFNPSVVKYFDLEAKGFRTLRIERLLEAA